MKIQISLLLLALNVCTFAQVPIYNHSVNPKAFPDYSRRNFLAPTPEETFKDTVRFVGARNDIPDASHMFYGNFYRPNQSWSTQGTLTLAGDIAKMVRDGIGVFDVGGYGPGTPNTGSFGQATVSKNNLKQLDRLGNMFVGNSLGEQDGRYWADLHSLIEPGSSDPKILHTNLLNYIRQNAKDYGYKLTQLTTWWAFHYAPKDGYISAIGSECHNKDRVSHIQLQQAFNRGVSRQYGLVTFGDVSVFNTWGYKSYSSTGSNYGPTWGSSVALMKRMMVLQYQSNAWILGFENEWKDKSGSPLPVGKVQKGMYNMVMNEYPQAGGIHVPVAFMTDFFSGWMPPYRNEYKKWGFLPYDRGNYLTHELFSLIYPSYEQNGQKKNEDGAILANKYGDVDAILSDIHAELMLQYPVIVAADSLMTDMSVTRDKIRHYVTGGGIFVVTANNARNLFPDAEFGKFEQMDANTNITYGTQSMTETNAFRYCSSSLTGNTIASANSKPLALEMQEGKGKYIILLTDFGMTKGVLPKMLNHTKAIIGDLCSKHQLFSAGENVTCMVNALDANSYLIGIYNNTLQPKTFELKSKIGTISSMKEISLGEDLTSEVGYTPEGAKIDFGTNSNTNIRALDVRMFKVTVEQALVTDLPEITYPKLPTQKYFVVNDLMSVKDKISGWPHFFHYFSGIKTDWDVLENVDNKAFKEEVEWINHQKMDLIIDFSNRFQLLDFRPENVILYNQLTAKLKNLMSNLMLFTGNKTIFLPEPTNQLELLSLKEINACCKAEGVQMVVRKRNLTEEQRNKYFAELNNLTNEWATANTTNEEELNAATYISLEPSMTPIKSSALSLVYDAKSVIFDLPVAENWDQVYKVISAIREKKDLIINSTEIKENLLWKVSEDNVNHYVAMHRISSLKETVIKNQRNFFTYFGGVKIDGKYLWGKSIDACREEGRWLKEKGIGVIVDLIPEIDLYPNLTWVKELATYKRGKDFTDNILEKMEAMGISQIIIGSHMRCEHWSSTTVTNEQSIKNGMKLFTEAAKKKGIVVHIQHRGTSRYPFRLLANPTEVQSLVREFAGTRFAMNLGLVLPSGVQDLLSKANSTPGVIIYAYPGSADFDLRNSLTKGPYRGENQDFSILPTNVPQILDAEYVNWSEIIKDCKLLNWKPINL